VFTVDSGCAEGSGLAVNELAGGPGEYRLEVAQRLVGAVADRGAPHDPDRQLGRVAAELDVSLVGGALGPRFLQFAIFEGHRAAVSPNLLPSSSRVF
jgi:hypothetical protein